MNLTAVNTLCTMLLDEVRWPYHVYTHEMIALEPGRDVVEKGADSLYASWFAITDFGPPLQWQGWNRPNGDLVRFAPKGCIGILVQRDIRVAGKYPALADDVFELL